MSNLAMLAHAPRLSARLSVTVEECTVLVSTVVFERQRYTRVEADECETLHYLGEVGAIDAARNYLNGAGCVETD